MSTSYILVTGATGKQGGALLRALLSPPIPNTTILALTRNTQSRAAQELAALSPQVKLIQGDLNDLPSVFAAVEAQTSKQPLLGVFAVQTFAGKGNSVDTEEAQGKALVDESVKQGVQHFVYSSVDRGGEEKSWTNPTNVPHFKSKHNIEQHLRTAAGDKMGWTILRPAAFLENLVPGFATRVFLAGLNNRLGKHKRMQWVSVADIGYFGAQALRSPREWNHRAISLAGDELTVGELSTVFEAQTGKALQPTFGLLGTVLTHAVHEVGVMVEWFRNEGFGADIAKLREQHSGLQDVAAWIKTSEFVKSK